MTERVAFAHSRLRYGTQFFQVSQQEGAYDGAQFGAFGMLTLPDGVGQAV